MKNFEIAPPLGICCHCSQVKLHILLILCSICRPVLNMSMMLCFKIDESLINCFLLCLPPCGKVERDNWIESWLCVSKESSI